MLTQTDVIYGDGSDPQILPLPILGITPKDHLLLRTITGLNPPDIALFIGDYARDGGTYQGRRVGNRNIVLTIDLNPNPALDETVSSLRQLLYKIFVDPLVDNDYVQFIFHDDDGSQRYTFGYAEKFETELFNTDSTVQISIICPDPYIRDANETILIPPEGSSGWTTVPFTYEGSAETGFNVSIAVNSPTNVITLENNSRTMVFTNPNGFVAGDVIHISTVRGSRDASYVRSGVTYPLIAMLSYLSPWLELHSQSNLMKVYGETTSNLPVTITSLTYTTSYWGI